MPPSKDGPIRVLAVVHNRILREGIRCLIETQPDFELAAAVSTVEDAVLQFTHLRPDLTLLDLDLPDDGGLHAIRRIRHLNPAAWIIALITDEADERGVHAVALGAATVIAKHRIGKVPWRNPSEGQIPPKNRGIKNQINRCTKRSITALNWSGSMNIIPRFLRSRGRQESRPAALRVSPFVRASAHDDGLALLHIQRGQVFLCNRTGSRIWQGLFDGRKPEEVADEISRHYGVQHEIAREHTLSFVDELERRGLITRTAEA